MWAKSPGAEGVRVFFYLPLAKNTLLIVKNDGFSNGADFFCQFLAIFWPKRRKTIGDSKCLTSLKKIQTSYTKFKINRGDTAENMHFLDLHFWKTYISRRFSVSFSGIARENIDFGKGAVLDPFYHSFDAQVRPSWTIAIFSYRFPMCSRFLVGCKSHEHSFF